MAVLGLSGEEWTAIGAIVGVVALVSVWFFYLRPKRHRQTSASDGAVALGTRASAGDITTTVTKTPRAGSSGDGAVALDAKASAGKITTNVDKTGGKAR